MRAKVVLSASVLALAVVVPAAYFHYKPANAPPPVETPAAVDNNAAPDGLPPILKRITQDRPPEGLPTRPANPVNLSGSDRENFIIERKAELADLGMSSDPAALKTILSELENPEPEIRQAALSATIDFGSKGAIPQLQNEMSWATDPQEKVNIQKAIDFLQLPSFGSDGDTVTQQSSDQPPPTN